MTVRPGTDRRRLRFNGEVAHELLRGQVAAARFTEGELARVIVERTPILAAPEPGPRERELVLGEGFVVLDRRGGMAFGFAARDGYVGWIEAGALQPGGPAPSHRIARRHSYAKATPALRTRDEAMWLSFGAQVAVTAAEGPWRRITLGADAAARHLWVPAAHLAPVGSRESDPVAVAELLLGTPYLWGGNSSFGIDCSGLVQVACLACGIPCPGDSDQQAEELGREIAADEPPQRGDLLFWTGHVAWVAGANRLLHANAHHMAVACEPMDAALARIAAQGDGQVIRRRRP